MLLSSTSVGQKHIRENTITYYLAQRILDRGIRVYTDEAADTGIEITSVVVSIFGNHLENPIPNVKFSKAEVKTFLEPMEII